MIKYLQVIKNKNFFNYIQITIINEYNPLMGRDNSEIFFQFVKRIINKLEKIKNE